MLRFTHATLAASLLPLAAGLATSPLVAQISQAEYAARRDTVAARLGDGVLLAFGVADPATDAAEYRQLPSFGWLTGHDRLNAVFVMVVRDGRPAYQMLFEPPIDPRRALYDGFAPDSADLARRTGLGLTALDQLRRTLDRSVRGTLWVASDVDSRDYLHTDSLTRGRRFVQDFWASRPGVAVRSADPLLDSLRVRKSPAELALLRRAIAITDDAHRAAMARVAPGVIEREIQALTDYRFRLGGASGPAFRAIVGSGANSTSYHYRANDRPMQAGDVVVIDIGALYLGYAADVTRTLPVSGRFSADQAAVYRIVREAQAAAEGQARAGAAVSAGDSAIRAVEARRLAELGLIESPDATLDPPWADASRCERVPIVCRQAFLYQAHGPGHGIGLEVHDVGGYSYSPTGRFQEGEVFTIEPGIYISTQLLDMLPDTPRNRAFIAKVRPVVERFHGIGVRIEDDYVVTATGVEWLSRAPREIADIEAAMRARGGRGRGQ
jgi:Xaa-Pro aminopeptidase